MENRMEISLLMDHYGVLLTEKQRSIMSMYYDMDLSLSEIAENQETSRQAIHDLVKRCIRILEDYEGKLSLMRSSQESERTKERIMMVLGESSLKDDNTLLQEIRGLLGEI
jgi:hypothetical protein